MESKKIEYKPFKPIMDRESSSKSKLVIQELSGYLGHYGVYKVDDMIIINPWNSFFSDILYCPGYNCSLPLFKY